jgi:hypothetical protein
VDLLRLPATKGDAFVILNGTVVNLSPAQLFEHLGVTLTRIGCDLEVRFANGKTDHYIPAPDGYPLDGSKSFINHEGEVFVPLDEEDR